MHLPCQSKTKLSSPCRAMASLKGCRSVSTDEPVSAGELALLGATMASRELVLLLLCGGALPHRKLIRSSLRMVLRRFFTQASISCKEPISCIIWLKLDTFLWSFCCCGHLTVIWNQPFSALQTNMRGICKEQCWGHRLPSSQRGKK